MLLALLAAAPAALAAREGPRLAVVVPFVPWQMADPLAETVAMWASPRHLPCGPAGAVADLFFYAHAPFDGAEAVLGLVEPAAAACFGRMALLVGREGGVPDGESCGAKCDQALDVLLGAVPEEPAGGLAAAYTHMLYVEPDTRPVRDGWAAEALRLATVEDGRFWMMGSMWRGPGKPGGPSTWWHINGNALYALREPKFHAFLREVRRKYSRGETAHVLYDVAFDRERRMPANLWMTPYFVYTDFVQNWSRQPVAQWGPGTFLVHS